MANAKRFEDWIIYDAHEFQYEDGSSMSGDSFAFQLEMEKLQDVQAKWNAIPWDAIAKCAVIADDDPDYRIDAKAVRKWIQEAQK